MKFAVSVGLILACALSLLLLMTILVVDMAARIEWVEDKAPWLVRFAKHKPWHTFVLWVAFLLLAVNAWELKDVELPRIETPPLVISHFDPSLSGHVKSGQRGSVQNRPTEVAED